MEKLKAKTRIEQGRNKPNIRFPEFKEDWEFKNGGNVFETVSNKNHNSDLPILAISQEFGAVPREMINYQISVTDKSVASYKVVDVGDYIISLRSFQGGIEYSNYKGICSPAYIILRPFIEIDRDFFRYYFKTYKYIQQLNSKLEGIRDGKMISFKYFSEIPLPFPTLPEQKRIAAFFTVVDKKIAKLKQKKSLLEQYKKGVMQKLFLQELRFKDDNGKEFPKWEKKKLGDLTEKINSGKTPLGGESVYTKSGILFIRSQNIIDNKLSLDNSTYIPVEINNTMKNSIVIANDILLNITGASLGRSCVVPKDFEIGNVNQHVCIIRMNKQNEPRFVQAYFSTNEGQNLFNTLQTGSGREGLNFQSIRNISMYMPSLEEQTKIANFLSAIDEKIYRTENQIQQTQEWKKGLLQNMNC